MKIYQSELPNSVELIDAHLDEYFLEEDISVLHEKKSEVIHSDIYIVKAIPDRPFQLLLSCGLSALPMKVPSGFEHLQYAEITMLLPPDWCLDYNSFFDENNYWPIRTLKELSKLPHTQDTWLGYSHTYPLEEFRGSKHKFVSVILLNSFLLPDDFMTINNGGKEVLLYAAIPIYKEELEYKIEFGTEMLLEKFQQFDIDEVVDIYRPNTCLQS